MYILHVAAFRRSILVGGLNVYISHYFQYIGTIKTVGGWRWRTAQTLYSNLFRTKEKPGGKRGWRLSCGGLAGFYCTFKIIKTYSSPNNSFNFMKWHIYTSNHAQVHLIRKMMTNIIIFLKSVNLNQCYSCFAVRTLLSAVP